MTEHNNRGRTFWDFISENPKKTFVTIVILALLLVFIIVNKYSFKNNYFSLEPEKTENTKNVPLPDSVKENINEILKTSLPKNLTVKQYYPTKEKTRINIPKKDSVIKQPMINVSSTNQSGGITANQVNIGAIPRNLDENLKNQLLENLKNKSEKIDIASVMGDSEAFRFANQINDFLKNQGYLNVEGVSQAVYSKPMIGQYLNRDTKGIKIIIGSKPE